MRATERNAEQKKPDLKSSEPLRAYSRKARGGQSVQGVISSAVSLFFTDVFRLSEMRCRFTFCQTMKPSAGAKESGGKDQELSRLVQFQALRQRKPSRDLLLVRWAAWAVIAVFIGLVILVLWGLATHEPSQLPFDSDM